MKEITQQNGLKKILEYIVRSNLYLFVFFRLLAGKYLTRFAHEEDFQIFSHFDKKNTLFLDIGANDGISAKTFRLYNKLSKILSIEINPINQKKLKKLKCEIDNYDFKMIGASSVNSKALLYQAYFKNFHLSSFDSLSFDEIYESLKTSLFDKKRLKYIKIKKKKVSLIKLDQLNLKPDIIKIDIQGHEMNALKGLIKTIKKYRPLLLVEFNKDSLKIIKFLKRYDYKPFVYRSYNRKLFPLKKNTAFNFFLLQKKHLDKIPN